MNDKDIVNTILEFVPTVDFTTTRKEHETISLFETTIRYIGGLLSGTYHGLPATSHNDILTRLLSL